jgi:quercetin dioxygenase-like cupin family protein
MRIGLALGSLFTSMLLSASPGLAEEIAYEIAPHGTRWLDGAGGLAIKVLVEEANLGGAEVEVAEITFPAGARGGNHEHGSIEIFYVLSGVMEHVVNDRPYRLEPGMVGVVRPGDRVAHRVLSDEPVKALVVWAPGGEAERLSRFFQTRPVEE